MLAGVDHDETDGGRRKVEPGAERLCVVTREVNRVEEMIRFVIGPDGSVVPDLKRKLPGRGVWATATRAAIAEAVQRRAFARGFKQEVRIAPDFADQVERLIERAALDALGIVRKSGRVAIGAGKTEAALATEPVVALLHAREAGEDGVRKMAAAARRRLGADADKIASIRAFTSAQLDLALGRSNVVHAALLAGPASDGFLGRCRSLEHFRAADGRPVRNGV